MCFVLVRPFPDGNRQLKHDRSPARSCAIKSKMQYLHSPGSFQPASLQTKPLIWLLLLSDHTRQVWDLSFLIDFEVVFKC